MVSALLMHLVSATVLAADPVTVGSKKFTESVILGEAVVGLLQASGFDAGHRRELGGSRVLWNALLDGAIDIYPEYSGTLRYEILANQQPAPGPGLEGLRAAVAPLDIGIAEPLGFNNGYALGMLATRARELGIETISDLRRHPGLVIGSSNEFLRRGDGWPGLQAAYALPQKVRGMDHDLAYRGLGGGSLDVLVLYTTDAGIKAYDIQPLIDDRGYFPGYQALLLYRSDLALPVVTALQRLSGKIDEAAMIDMNAAVKLDGRPESRVAASLLQDQLGIAPVTQDEAGRGQRIWQRTREHLLLVSVSLTAAILVALPLGIIAARRPRPGRWLLSAAGVLQTLPALALLVFMIPLLGIGPGPAIAALFLYSLLPIMRNTYTGLTGIPNSLLESADALGLPSAARLRRVELPLAAASIMAGIKTAAVINIGTATLGALIGAGGYGQPILTGIRLDDTALILEGAIPAALLALLAQALLDGIEHWLVPRGMRGMRGMRVGRNAD
jgi:osmoprotectant transport system permease protein